MRDRYFVYILTNDRHTVLYTGVTNDLLRRVGEHRAKLAPGFTARYNVGKLVYFDEMNDVKCSDHSGKADQGWVATSEGRTDR
jgi:putative endonuclease